MSTNIGLSRDQKIFAIKETTKGTLRSPTGMKHAKGTITLTSVPSGDDTLTIGSQEFVFKTTRAEAGEITIGLTAAACVTNIVSAITTDIPTIATAEDGAGDTVVVTAVTPGRAGNAVVFTENADNLTINGTGTLGATQAGANGEQIFGTGTCDISQDPNFVDSPEIIEGTIDILERFQGQTSPGTWSMDFILRTDAAGYVPMADPLFECLLGAKATNAGTSIVYSIGEKPSFSLWCLEGHHMKFARGCSCDQMDITEAGKDVVKIKASGKCMQVYQCGTGALSAAANAAATTISVSDARFFDVGSYIQDLTTANAGDNSGAGYQVTDRVITAGHAADTITITPAVPTGGWGNADVIAPFLPEGMKIGTAVEGRKAALNYGGATKTMTGCTISIKNPAYYVEDDISTTGYTEDFIDGKMGDRDISANIDALFRKADAVELYNAQNDVARAFSLILGTTVGKRLKIDIPYGKISVPKPTFSAPVIKLPIVLKAYGSVGEDSCTLTFY